MREILFKAKRKNWRELPKEEWWVEGLPSYGINGEITEIEHWKGFANCEVVEIDPETICQYTGLKDKDGNRIWENDIVMIEIAQGIGTVKLYIGDYVGWCVDDIFVDEQQYSDDMWNECEVIGNIFDNPELLERS